MKKYIETRIVKVDEIDSAGTKLYVVIDEAGNKSFQRPDVFERNHILVDSDNTTVTQTMVDNFIAEVTTQTLALNSEKLITITTAILKNGFTITESSSCVCVDNYDKKIGEEICLGKIKSKVWTLLGFILAAATNEKTY